MKKIILSILSTLLLAGCSSVESSDALFVRDEKQVQYWPEQQFLDNRTASFRSAEGGLMLAMARSIAAKPGSVRTAGKSVEATDSGTVHVSKEDPRSSYSLKEEKMPAQAGGTLAKESGHGIDYVDVPYLYDYGSVSCVPVDGAKATAARGYTVECLRSMKPYTVGVNGSGTSRMVRAAGFDDGWGSPKFEHPREAPMRAEKAVYHVKGGFTKADLSGLSADQFMQQFVTQ